MAGRKNKQLSAAVVATLGAYWYRADLMHEYLHFMREHVIEDDFSDLAPYWWSPSLGTPTSGYTSGPSRHWVKSKCPDWKRINVERHKLFEGPRRPEVTEAQKTLDKKRLELARVIERLRSPPLSHGIAREMRKQQFILEREIAELEK